jgi:hypothetical protein
VDLWKSYLVRKLHHKWAVGNFGPVDGAGFGGDLVGICARLGVRSAIFFRPLLHALVVLAAYALAEVEGGALDECV